ncbi:hypothetical protein [Klebsiella pneumoniae]|uniref:hypothetical protein n=1 Tax=Klebsiella pneumoniae TaxID=573 RepID=UPI00388D3444
MTAQDVINVLTILKANDSTSFSKIQRALKMSISQLEGIIDGLTAMGILYKSSFTSYSLTELTSKPVVSDGVRKAFEDIITNRGILPVRRTTTKGKYTIHPTDDARIQKMPQLK